MAIPVLPRPTAPAGFPKAVESSSMACGFLSENEDLSFKRAPKQRVKGFFVGNLNDFLVILQDFMVMLEDILTYSMVI